MLHIFKKLDHARLNRDMARAPGNSSAIVSCPNGSGDVRKSVVRSLAIFCRAAFSVFASFVYYMLSLHKKICRIFQVFFCTFAKFFNRHTQKKKMRKAMIDGEIDFTEEAS